MGAKGGLLKGACVCVWGGEFGCGILYQADGLLQKSDKLVFKLAIAPQLLKCLSGLAMPLL